MYVLYSRPPEANLVSHSSFDLMPDTAKPAPVIRFTEPFRPSLLPSQYYHSDCYLILNEVSSPVVVEQSQY